MDTEALKIVALVAQQGSLAGAARVLNMDPSSVSRTVAGLEARLGLRIFERTTRSLRTTEAGETYLRRVAPLIDEFDRAREEAARTRTDATGTLRITASVAFAQECIVPHLGDFQIAHPKLSVELLPSDANIDIAAEGIDLAIRLTDAPSGDLTATRLLQTRYRVCAAPAYLARAGRPKVPGDLAKHDCLRFALREYRSRWLFREGGTEMQVVPVSGRLVIGSALALRAAARDGLGPALLADWLVRRDLERGQLVDLFPGHEVTATDFDTGAWALYPSRSYLPQKVRVAIDFFRVRLRPDTATE